MQLVRGLAYWERLTPWMQVYPSPGKDAMIWAVANQKEEDTCNAAFCLCLPLARYFVFPQYPKEVSMRSRDLWRHRISPPTEGRSPDNLRTSKPDLTRLPVGATEPMHILPHRQIQAAVVHTQNLCPFSRKQQCHSFRMQPFSRAWQVPSSVQGL